MIPTPSFGRVDVIRSSFRDLAYRDGLNGQFDKGGLPNEEPAGFKSNVPGQPEVLAVDLGGCAEADSLVAHGGCAATVELDFEGDGPGGAVHSQVTRELPRVVAQWLHGG